jgi:hypothetical protein
LLLMGLGAGRVARGQSEARPAGPGAEGAPRRVDSVRVLGPRRLAPRLLSPLRRAAALDTVLRVPKPMRSLSGVPDPPERQDPGVGDVVGPMGGGESAYRPYRQEPSVYHTLPALRYTRVEGLVVGAQRPPAGWSTGGPLLHPYGQASYALGLEAVRAVGGLEVWLDRPSAGAPDGLKAGVHAGRTTATSDAWKRSWSSNSVSALVYGDDLFNYYDVRQATAYLVRRFSPQLQASVGARWAEHGSLERTASWSLLDRSPLGPNPPAEAGTAATVLAAVEAGLLHRQSEHRSTGTIGRLYAAVGAWPGADLRYNRVVADVQSHVPVGPKTNLELRARAGRITHEAPVQLQFRLDGVRGLRAFDPARRAGRRMALGGVQLAAYGLPGTDVSSVHLAGFVDAGWTGDGAVFQGGSAFGYVGGSVFVFDRLLGLEITWPLHRPTDWRPDVSFKLNPLG